jgi:hypothetical protein
MASDAIVLQLVMGSGWPGHEAACPPKPGKKWWIMIERFWQMAYENVCKSPRR